MSTLSNDEELSESELAVVRMGFDRFRVSYTQEIHKDSLCELLQHLGHLMLPEAEVQRLADEVTQFAYLSFDELAAFMRRYLTFETSRLRNAFATFERGHSGCIQSQDLRPLMANLGFSPFREPVQEALAAVVGDDACTVGFEDFGRILALFRRSEGFTSAEIAQLRRVFDRVVAGGQEGNDAPRLPIGCFREAMLLMFGPQVECFARSLELELASRAEVAGERCSGLEGPRGLLFPELVAFARRLREAQLDAYRYAFSSASGNNTTSDGRSSVSELRCALQDLGYTSTTAVVEEVLRDAVEEGCQHLGVDEVLDFMPVFCQREGFSKDELAFFQVTFKQFDADASGEVSVLELSAMLRSLGYVALDLDEVHASVAQVDVNGSNALDFREFLRLMRLQREVELTRIRAVFESRRGTSALLPASTLGSALSSLGHDFSVAKTGEDNSPGLDFEVFVTLVDRCRKRSLVQRQWLAGFSEQEVACFRALFERYDRDMKGVVDSREMADLLADVGVALRSREDRRQVLEKLDAARLAARKAGVDDVSAQGGATVRFWEVVQFLRILHDERDRAEEECVSKAAADAKFSWQEVQQFREVFLQFSKAPDVSGTNAGQLVLLPSHMLELDGMKGLLKSIGVTMKSSDRECLNQRFAALVGDVHGTLSFADFLRFMRWLTDSNFACINEVVAPEAATVQTEAGSEPHDLEINMRDDRAWARRVVVTKLLPSTGKQTPSTRSPSTSPCDSRAPSLEPQPRQAQSSVGGNWADGAAVASELPWTIVQPGTESVVEAAYRMFNGPNSAMDCRCFAKACKDACLLDGQCFTVLDADLIFTKVVRKHGHSRMDLQDFEAALGLLAEKRGFGAVEVLQALSACVGVPVDRAPPRSSCARPEASIASPRGPSRKMLAQLSSAISALPDGPMGSARSALSDAHLAGAPSRALIRVRTAPRTIGRMLEAGEEPSDAPRSEQQPLIDAFSRLSGARRSLGRLEFKRLCGHCLLVGSGLSAVDTDNIFVEAAAEHRALDFRRFKKALKLVAAQKAMEEAAVHHVVVLCAGTASAAASRAVSPTPLRAHQENEVAASRPQSRGPQSGRPHSGRPQSGRMQALCEPTTGECRPSERPQAPPLGLKCQSPPRLRSNGRSSTMRRASSFRRSSARTLSVPAR